MKLEKVILKDICELLNRGVSPKYSDQGNLIINQKCIRNNIVSLNEARYSSEEKKISTEKYLKPLDILVNSTGTGTLGRTAQIKEVNQLISVDTHVTIVRPNSKVDKKFIGFQLALKEPEIISLGKGATNQQELGRTELGGIELLLPPLPTQRKIASILSAYDNLIENNLKRIKLLEEIAQRTYEEWFVKFCINGKLLKINKETGLPDGWEEISLGMFVNFHKGKKANSIVPEFQEGFERLLLLDGIESGKYPYADPKGQVIAERGDIVMLMDGARSSKVFFADKGIVGSTLSKIEITNKSISSSLLKLFFDSNFETMKTNNTGAAIPHANKNFINTMPFKKPTKDVLKKWEESLDPLYKQIQNLKDQNLLLKESRDILLPRLMSGVIEVG